MSKKVYRGEEIEVYFDAEKCTHSGVCVKGMPEVFDLKKRPWVNTEGASADKIAAHIDTCPSGALTYKWKSKSSDNAMEKE
ncbi:(4Fe-4S)-binding protein [Paenibacillus sp. D2_2]|uniref:(4Fe-4S)-binding protein n=1 Tax=Paenibacillus sp. D2_2 TaxID=3073092 RepID=UPI0028153E2D|nr:(4Fe-4S)-binding protein [Paenibacillus sp. D2_2]WMT42943.1 (4Fe-4S)-binding protein [Paenibacillus sp. D2_2]